MTESSRQRPGSDLERLYRDAGDAEPAAGIDRMIRARAERAAFATSSRRRLPWLGGLATASVAVVAIAVVLQQSPPAGRAPETSTMSGADRESTDQAAARQPEAAELGTEGAARREAEPRLRANRSFGGDGDEDVPGSAGTPDAARSRSDLAPAEAPEAAAPVQEAVDEVADRPMAGPVAAKLIAIGELIDAGEMERARVRLESFRAQHPDVEIPADLIAALDQAPPGG